MKTHTSNFKNKIKEFGRQLDNIITYQSGDEIIELGSEQLNSITPHYEGSILKSVMKQLDIDSNVDIPIGTELEYQFGIKTTNNEVENYKDNYEYISYGNYIVYSSERQEDTLSYKIVCYDKMLYSMTPYQALPITYPITIRNYIKGICNQLGLVFKNENSTFANYDKEITKELYLDANGNDLGYTFRDVLDELAGATGSIICINENDDELEVRYVNETNDTIDEEYLKDINVKFGEKYGPINSVVLSRSAESDNIYARDDDSIALNGLCEIKIKDNQILNDNNRDEFLPDLLQALDGLEYYVNDFSSTGIMYYNLFDKYNVQIGQKTYSCIMFNDEANITQGLEEQIYTEMPEESETDYAKADKTDRRINQAYIIVDKQTQQINSVVSSVNASMNEMTDVLNSQKDSIEALGTRLTQTTESLTATVSTLQTAVEDGATTLKNTSVTIDNEGLSVSTDTSKIKTTMDNDSFEIKDSGNNTLVFIGYDEEEQTSKANMDNLTINHYLTTGVHRIEKIEGEDRTGFFYIGG